MEGPPPRLVVCSTVGEARGAMAAGAALAVASAGADRAASAGPVALDLRGSARVVRGAVLASDPARRAQSLCSRIPGLHAVARGRICFATPTEDGSGEDRAAGLLGELLDLGSELGPVVAVCDPRDFRGLVGPELCAHRSVLLKASPGRDRALISLLAAGLRRERIPVKVWVPTIGSIGARRAMAGLEAGGDSGRRAGRLAASLLGIGGPARASRVAGRMGMESGQALPAVLGISILIVALALIGVAIGGAATAKGRLQRSADLAAISAARSMRDDFSRLFVPAALPGGRPNPAHLERNEYLLRARQEASRTAERNGLDGDLVEVTFPDSDTIATLQVEISIDASIGLTENLEAGPSGDREVASVSADAEVTLPASSSGSLQPEQAEGGGYAGPLAYRQGKPMRPDVAAAFDRLEAAARSAGVSITITSGYRSDAEQQRLWNANPDPRWVAPPGTSLHRCGTELDLGPSSAYGWLAANASRFGFVKRYSWEPWHFGYDGGPEPCSEAGERVAQESARRDGVEGRDPGLPSFVPDRYREALLAAAARNDVSAALLAAQLMAESNFNPNAVSSAGASGIAQFMPATAASYGLTDPFDPFRSIAAQARMMGELMAQFGSVDLALAAYNAGPGTVAACGCVPPYPETQAYVARILALLDGAGELAVPAPALEVRLVG